MRRHMVVRAALGVMLAAVGLISLNPLFLLVGGIYLYTAHDLWKKEQEDRDDKGEKRG